jgi:O-antigen/teichoic acid export membrane protein
MSDLKPENIGHGVVRNVARNTTVQVVVEGLSKLASLALYIVIARVAGPAEFGNFVFALSLALLLTVMAGMGVEGVIVRAVARDPSTAPRLLTDGIALRVAAGAIAVGVAMLVAVVGDYSKEVQLGVGLLALSAMIDQVTKCFFATFQAMDDLRPVAACLLVQRCWTAGWGIAAVALGARLGLLAVIFISGSLFALVCAWIWLARRGVSLAPGPSVRRSLALARQAFNLGVTLVFNTVLFRGDATMLSLMKGNLAVGFYGVAYRLLESTLFLTYDFVAALSATLARLRRDTTPPVARAYEFGCRVMALVLVPIGDLFVAFPQSIISLLYGSRYDAAVGVMRLLGVAAVTYGFAYLSSTLLIGQDRDRVLPWIHLVAAVQNVALNLALIPPLSYTGAAISTSVAETTRTVLLMWYSIRSTGPIRWIRVVLGPAVGTAALAAVALVGGNGLGVLVGACAAYAAAALLVERLVFPGDAGLVIAALRRRPAAESLL